MSKVGRDLYPTDLLEHSIDSLFKEGGAAEEALEKEKAILNLAPLFLMILKERGVGKRERALVFFRNILIELLPENEGLKNDGIKAVDRLFFILTPVTDLLAGERFLGDQFLFDAVHQLIFFIFNPLFQRYQHSIDPTTLEEIEKFKKSAAPSPSLQDMMERAFLLFETSLTQRKRITISFNIS